MSYIGNNEQNLMTHVDVFSQVVVDNVVVCKKTVLWYCVLQMGSSSKEILFVKVLFDVRHTEEERKVFCSCGSKTSSFCKEITR